MTAVRNEVTVTVTLRINGRLSRVTVSRPIEMPSAPTKRRAVIRGAASDAVATAVAAVDTEG